MSPGGIGVRAARAFDLLLAALGALAGLAIAAIALLVSLDVLMRNVGLGTLPWLLELVEYALYGATFLAAPWVLSLGAHVRVDIVVTSLPRRAAAALEVLVDLAGAAVALVLMRYGLEATLEARRIGALIIKTLIVPEWWLLAVIPFASLLLAVEFVRRALRPAAAARRSAPAEGL
jgi:TRAP-type C4-dicarboxylate transport system permease small subunit